jgi:hypothetical protein
MAGRWLRLNMDYADSPWLDALPGDTRRIWPDLLCWAKAKGTGGVCRAPDLVVLSKRIDAPKERIASLIHAAVQDGALEVTKEQWTFTNWTKWNPYDATATERKRKQRAKGKGDNTVPFPAEKASR